MRESKAFSLIELLIVIALLSILMSLLLPALGKARRTGHDAVCLSNLRQVGAAFEMYSHDYTLFPWGDSWTSKYHHRFGWGGVHWYGHDQNGVPIVPPTDPELDLLTGERPLNSYMGDSDVIEATARWFHCPADYGVRIPVAQELGFKEDPWAGINPLNPDAATVFGQMGTSYESNDLMWKVGWESWAPKWGPKDVYVPASLFVLAGDAGGMTIAEVGHVNNAMVQGWWHGDYRCQMVFLDGHASHRNVLGEPLKNGYSFNRMP